MQLVFIFRELIRHRDKFNSTLIQNLKTSLKWQGRYLTTKQDTKPIATGSALRNIDFLLAKNRLRERAPLIY
jgi:hypothetical protein